MLLIFLFLIAILLLIPFLANNYSPKQSKCFHVATVAMKCSDNINENINKITSIINGISETNKDIDLIFFGEMILSKYFISKDQLSILSLEVEDKRIKNLCELARVKNIILCFGFIEFFNENYYNSQIIIDSNGKVLGVHRKRNLTRFESTLFSKGQTCLSMFKSNDIKIGTAICYDVFHKDFNEAFKSIKPHILLHSLADPQNPLFTTGYNGRKTNSFYVSANRYGKEGSTFFNGHIATVNSSGKIIELKHGKESNIVSHFFIPLNEGKLNKLLNSASNSILMVFHLITHYKHVINYLKWDKKMKKEKQKLNNI